MNSENEGGLDIKVRPSYRLLLVLIAFTLLSSVLVSAFEEVEVGPLMETEDQDGERTISRTGRWSGNGLLLVESVLIGSGIIFEVQGKLNTSYLRTNAYTTYDDGAWSVDEEYTAYPGGYLNGTKEAGPVGEVTMVPRQGISGQLISVQRTLRLQGEGLQEVEHSEELDAFRTSVPVASPYIVTYENREVPVAELVAKGVNADGSYVHVPSDIAPDIRELASFIVRGIDAPYERVLALISFLKDHYTYLPFYSETPKGVDKVEWFLFNSKTGMCTHFNSALVLMARSIGIPARICSGYLVQPDADMQNVTSLQAHAYAEIRFGQDTWTIFDATPESRSYDEGWDEESSYPSLTGSMFDDRDRDRALGVLDTGLDHWNVMLMDQVGKPIQMELTSTSGRYSFHVPSGDYILRAFAQEGYVNTTPSTRSVHVAEYPISVDFGFNHSGGSDGTLTTYTNITSEMTEVSRGVAFQVQGRTVPSMGTVNGQMVQIFLTKDKSSSARYLCGQGEVEEGSFNVSCITLDDLPVGGYHLIARFLGDDVYAPSESDPPVVLKDGTTITIQGENAITAELGGTITIGLRQSSNGMPVPHAVLSVEADGIASTMTTSSQGEAILKIGPDVPRLVLLTVHYDGDAYLTNSSFHSALRVHPLEVEILSGDLVRNTTGGIVGRVHAGNGVPAATTEVGVRMKDDPWTWIAFNTTWDQNGMFRLEMIKNPYLPLGPCDFTLSVGDLTSFDFTLNITAMTIIEASVSGNTVDLTLRDDQGEPLAGRSLSLVTPFSTMVVVTDQTGRATAMVQVGEDCNCSIHFAADSHYASSTTEVQLLGSGPLGDLPIEWLVLLLAAIIPLVYLAFRRRRPASPANRLTELPPPGPYTVRSPQIGQGLPLVWESDRPLEIIVEGGEERVDLIIDGSSQQVVPGVGKWVVLPRGEHWVEVSGPQGRNLFLVRAVDYRKEMANLYLERMVELGSLYDRVTLDLAPREVLDRLGTDWKGYQALESMVDLFERSQFSEQSVGREDYEMMFRMAKGASR